MKTNLKKISLLLVSSLFFFSCANESEYSIENASQIKLNAQMKTYSRATDTEFIKGERIGVYMQTVGNKLLNNENYVTNQLFTVADAGALITDMPLEWMDGINLDLFAYAPYTPTVSNVNAYAYAIALNQSIPENYIASDFLWSSLMNQSPTANTISLNFNHKFSKLIIKLEAGSGFTGDLATAVVKITGTYSKAVIDLATGVPTTDKSGSTRTVTTAKETAIGVYKAILVPQKATLGIEVTIANKTYVGTVAAVDLNSGSERTCTVRVSEEALKINMNSPVNNWTPDEDITAPSIPGECLPTKYDQTTWNVVSVSSVNEGVGEANGFPTQGFAKNLIDNNYKSSYYAHWNVQFPHNFILDMKELLSIDGFIIYTGFEAGCQTKNVELLTSPDNIEWTSQGDYILGSGETIVNTKTDCALLSTVSARYFKLIMKSSWGGGKNGMQIAEVEAYKK